MFDSAPAITFARPDLTPITGESTNSSVKLLQVELNANAISIPSNRGGGAHGHLPLIQSPGNYLLLIGTGFEPPINPGLTPTLPASANVNQITVANRQYRINQSEYFLYLASNTTSKPNSHLPLIPYLLTSSVTTLWALPTPAPSFYSRISHLTSPHYLRSSPIQPT
jgi:hypothetical protein